MDYKIIGQTVPLVEMKLNAGESVYTQSGGMVYGIPIRRYRNENKR